MSITQEMIDRAAKYLRETTQGGKTNSSLKEWGLLPKSAKKKWIDLAQGTLIAALTEGGE